MAVGRWSTLQRLAGGKVLIAAGSIFAAGETDTAELYNPVSGTWTTTGKLHNARAQHTATLLLNHRVLVAGGTDGSIHPIARAELYDPGTGTWVGTATLIKPRRDHTATLLSDGDVLVAAGIGRGANLNTAELYDSGGSGQ